MKNNFFFLSICFYLIGMLASANITAQEATVGKVQNGKGVITDEKAAIAVLKGGLSTRASIVKTYIELDQQSGKFYLVGLVENDKVTGKAVELQSGPNAGLIAIGGGPGLEVNCYGYNCGRCVPVITNWKPKCVCEDANPPGDMRCDMHTKVVISIW